MKLRALQMILGYALVVWLAAPAAAHTLPISYLQLVADADYLHLELVFNPFELTLMPELDDNKDAELNLTELVAHGQLLADRVVAGLKLSAGGTVLRPETVGMDPDLSGHHVRVRAHYKVDARRAPLTVDSGLPALTSASHLTQVTYVSGSQKQLAQLDPHSHKVTFQPSGKLQPAAAPAARRRGALALALVAATILFFVVGAALILALRKSGGR